MSREEVVQFYNLVKAIENHQAEPIELSRYSARQVADGIKSLIANEREACAQVAEAAAEPAGAIGRGDWADQDQERKRVCLDIAELIRSRASW